MLWGWAGEPLPAESTELLEKLRADLRALGGVLAEHLTEMELGSLAMRVERLLAVGRFPEPGEDWPAMPWPPM